jgi:probable HAF family extracellular repeat protein
MKAKTLCSTFVPASLLRRLRPLMRPSPILPTISLVPPHCGRADDEWSNEMSILQKLLIITAGVALIILGTGAEAWQTSYSITDLGTTFVLLDINEKGQIAGASGDGRALLYSDGRFTEISKLRSNDNVITARAINNKGQVIGNLSFSTFPPIYDISAFLYSRRTGMTNLGRLLPTDIFSVAADINNKGQVVGYSGTFSGFRAFVSSDDGVLQDLNNLIPLGSGFTLDSAYAINDKGEIVGIGFINGQQHGFLLEPAK